MSRISHQSQDLSPRKTTQSEMSGFKILEHTADIGIEVEGKTLNELFINSVKGLYFIIVGEKPKPVGKKISQRISLDCYDCETLLVEWLNEILFNAIVKKKYFDEFVLSISKSKLTAQLSGFTFDCCLKHEVKSATYHGLEIKKTSSGYKAKIIFDI